MLAGSAALLACSVVANDTASNESDHTEGEPTFAQHAWQWADETEEEFRKSASDTSGWEEAPEFLPTDHPMTKRLQFWLDRMDDALRAEYPDKLRGTPKPQVLVKKSEETNAWVSFLPVAFDVSTRLPLRRIDGGQESRPSRPTTDGGDADGGTSLEDSGVATPAEAVEDSVLLDRTGSVGRPYRSLLHRPHDATTLSELTRFFNDGFAKCRLGVEADALVIGDGCERDRSLRSNEAKSFAFHATAKFITFTSGYILELLDEDRVVSTLAHELGHFYRSHANMPTDVVNYFYSLEDGEARKPGPDPRFIEQTAKAREKLRAGAWYADWAEENRLMADRRLGFYTVEQEADELSLELITKIGIPPGVAVDKVLTMLKGRQDREGEMSWASCSTLREQGFRDDTGGPAAVPVGDPSNAHHNLCFRAFNLTREIEAHRYRIGERPTPPGEPWARLLTRLAAEVDPLLVPPSFEPAADAGPSSAEDGGAR